MAQIKASRYKPECRVLFYTELGHIIARSTVQEEGDSITPDVLSITTNNDMANDVGSFSITLSHHNRWDKVLASNDLVYIQMRRDSTTSWKDATVFIGLVDDIRKQVQVQESSITRNLIVTGRSLTKALQNFKIGTVKGWEGTAGSGTNGWIYNLMNGEEFDTIYNGSSSEIIKCVMNKIVFKHIKYDFANGKKLKDLLKLKLSSRAGECCENYLSFSTFEGGALEFIRTVANEPFNQVFFEIYDGEPTLIERPTPFSKNSWYDLPLWTVTDMQVVSNDVGRSDLETYAFFHATSDYAEQDLLVPPLYNNAIYERYGINMLTRSTFFSKADETMSQPEKLQAYTKDLHDFYILNNQFWNGEITVIGQHKYKVGDRLLYKSDEDKRDIEYFIEGVAHEFTNFESWTTTLYVTRGLPEQGKNRFSKPVGVYKEYTGGALGSEGNYPKPVQTVEGDYGTGAGSATGQSIAQLAISVSQQSTKYKLGRGRSKADWDARIWDCSSFVNYVYYQCGITLEGGGAYGQGFSTRISRKLGTKVSRSSLIAGDLVHWNTTGQADSHVGIYVGNGQVVACNTSTGVTLFDLDKSYWKSKESGNFRRIVTDVSSGGSYGTHAGLYGQSHPTTGYRVKQDWTNNWEITAYTTKDAGCNNITAIGTVIGEFPYHICAVAEELIDYRDLVEIEGLGVFYACDCGGAINGKHIDTLWNTKDSAFKWGTKRRRVRIWTKK